MLNGAGQGAKDPSSKREGSGIALRSARRTTLGDPSRRSYAVADALGTTRSAKSHGQRLPGAGAKRLPGGQAGAARADARAGLGAPLRNASDRGSPGPSSRQLAYAGVEAGQGHREHPAV